MTFFQICLLIILVCGFGMIERQIRAAISVLDEIRLHVQMTRQVTHEFRMLMYHSLVDVENGFDHAKLYKVVKEDKTASGEV